MHLDVGFADHFRPQLALGEYQRRQLRGRAALGLDAVARKSLFDELIDEMADRSTTIFLTTHDLAAADLVATHVGILAGGRLAVDEPLESLKQGFRAVRLRKASGAPGSTLDQEEGETLSLEEIFTAVTGERS